MNRKNISNEVPKLVTHYSYIRVRIIMVTVGFYTIDELNINQIIERFNVDYPNIKSEYNTNEEELILKNVTEDMENVDTFLCEEICHEFEVNCFINETRSNTSKNYYYDEDEEWVFK